MAAGSLPHPAAGDDLWASVVDAVFTAVDSGFWQDADLDNTDGSIDNAATFATSTTFTLTGDQTTIYTTGRRIKIVHGGGTSYGRIMYSSFSSPSTTVTVGNVTSGPVTMTTPITSVALSIKHTGNAGNDIIGEPDPILMYWGL